MKAIGCLYSRARQHMVLADNLQEEKGQSDGVRQAVQRAQARLEESVRYDCSWMLTMGMGWVGLARMGWIGLGQITPCDMQPSSLHSCLQATCDKGSGRSAIQLSSFSRAGQRLGGGQHAQSPCSLPSHVLCSQAQVDCMPCCTLCLAGPCIQLLILLRCSPSCPAGLAHGPGPSTPTAPSAIKPNQHGRAR